MKKFFRNAICVLAALVAIQLVFGESRQNVNEGGGTGGGGDVGATSNNVFSGKNTFSGPTTNNGTVTFSNQVWRVAPNAGGNGVSNSAPATTSSGLVTLGQMLATNANLTIPAGVTNSVMNFQVPFPTTTDDLLMGRLPTAVTIDEIRILCVGPTNVVCGVDVCDANGLNPVPVGADVTATNGGFVTITLTNAAVSANSWLSERVTSVSGTTVTSLVYSITHH